MSMSTSKRIPHTNNNNPYSRYSNVALVQSPKSLRKMPTSGNENKFWNSEKPKASQLIDTPARPVEKNPALQTPGIPNKNVRKGFKQMSGGSPKKSYGRSLKYYNGVIKTQEDVNPVEDFIQHKDLVTKSLSINPQTDKKFQTPQQSGSILREYDPNIIINNIYMPSLYTLKPPLSINQHSKPTTIHQNYSFNTNQSIQKQNSITQNNQHLSMSIKDMFTFDVKDNKQGSSKLHDSKDLYVYNYDQEDNHNKNNKDPECINLSNDKFSWIENNISCSIGPKFTKEDQISVVTSNHEKFLDDLNLNNHTGDIINLISCDSPNQSGKYRQQQSNEPIQDPNLRLESNMSYKPSNMSYKHSNNYDSHTSYMSILSKHQNAQQSEPIIKHLPKFETAIKSQKGMPTYHESSVLDKMYSSTSKGSFTKKLWQTPDDNIYTSLQSSNRKVIFDEEYLLTKKTRPHIEVTFHEPKKIEKYKCGGSLFSNFFCKT